MITAIVGKPGNGKTLYLVGQCRKFLNEGIDVYSNININPNEFKFKKRKKPYGKLYLWKEASDFKYIKSGKVLWDELGAYFDSRGAANFPPEVRIKFQQYRKDGLDIYYSVQSYGRADLIIRQLTNDLLECKKWMDIFFFVKKYDSEDYEKEKPKLLSLKIIIPDKKLVKAYNTFERVLQEDDNSTRFKLLWEMPLIEKNKAFKSPRTDFNDRIDYNINLAKGGD